MKSPKAKWKDERYPGASYPYLVYRASNSIVLASVSLVDNFEFSGTKKCLSASLWIVQNSDHELDVRRFGTNEADVAKKWVQKRIRDIFKGFE